MSLNPVTRDWRDRRVWIAGASSGIGHALARLLLERGARVAASARNEEMLRALAERYPGRVVVLPFDVKDLQAWKRSHATLLGEWSAIDQLVVCAAGYRPVRAWELQPEQIRDMVATNLQGAMTGVATVLPGMLARGSGAISLLASVAGYTGLPKALVYGPTKAALINFSEALYLDVHGRGIAVHLVNPGFVDTPLTRQNDFRMPALISAEEAAAEIVRGMERGQFEIHFPRRFTRWLHLLRRLPYPLRFAALAKIAEQP
ncbi:MAG: short-chain dehydrogenase [Moraxellaceae bacterium]|jgi:short-subunit dehydrogenase|nr:short-chain dehydrogenase [Moraxellaceae bacterium]